jgi:ketosteroid isomerase-like protein
VLSRNIIYASCFCTLTMMALPSLCAESGVARTSVADVSSETAIEARVKAAFALFVSAQNTRDPSVLSKVLVKSHDFVWAQGDGESIWGFDEAMAAWDSAWKGSWHLDPQLNELRIARIAPGVALLMTALQLTTGDPGEQPSTDRIRWVGVFVKTASGWRLSSLTVTPYPGLGKP